MTDEAKSKILVVDREITVCKSIRQALVCDAYDIEVALSGEEALKKENEKKFDVIIADPMTPGLGGLDLLKFLKAKNSPAKVIMIAGYPTLKTAVQSVQAGVFDHLPKPFLPSQLRSLVARALAPADRGK